MDERWAIDPGQIKVVNWSRRRKRNKKLWDPNPKRRNNRANLPSESFEELDQWLENEA